MIIEVQILITHCIDMFIDREILYRWNWDFNLIHEIYSPQKLIKPQYTVF